MNKVLCSLAVGRHAEMMRLARVTFEQYAARHGYTLELCDSTLDASRPPAWSKVLLIRELLASYDTILWVDADAIVLRFDVDVNTVAAQGRIVSLVKHVYRDQEVPNTGVMLWRRHSDTEVLLDHIWNGSQFTDHPWWEQAALLHLMGYDVSIPGRSILLARTEWHGRVGLLPREWNSIHRDPDPHPRIKHYAGQPVEAKLLGMAADLAGLNIEGH